MALPKSDCCFYMEMKLCILILSVLLLSSPVLSAPFIVNNNVDTVDAVAGDGICSDAFGNCTLRAAIETANELPDADDISFSLPAPSVIRLTLGALSISNSLTISSAAAGDLTVQAGATGNRVFTVSDADAVTLNRITVADANISSNDGDGGGIFHTGGTLNLNGVIIRNNSAARGGGIYSDGTLNISDSTITGNKSQASEGPFGRGGGIFAGAAARVTITGSTISNNYSFGGGGILFSNANSATITNSTISGNTADYAFVFGGMGGGISANNCSLNLTNVTITNNNDRVYSGGGIYAPSNSNSKIRARNTIIAGNNASDNFVGDINGVFISLGNNLIGNPGNSTGFINDVNGDRVGVKPLLAPLADNGGLTQTHAFLPNSPAVNAGNNCVVTADCSSDNSHQFLPTDQRGFGFSRQIGVAVDIGAFETDTFLSFSNNTLTGRVLRPNGGRITAGIVIITNSAGKVRYAVINPFGYFRFNNLLPGNYKISIKHKRYTFPQQTFYLPSHNAGRTDRF